MTLLLTSRPQEEWNLRYTVWDTVASPTWSTHGQGADRNREYQTELLRKLDGRLTWKEAGQSVARVFLDTEEVRGSSPLAPTTPLRCERAWLQDRADADGATSGVSDSIQPSTPNFEVA